MISNFAIDKYAVKMWEAVISTFAHCVLLINFGKLVQRAYSSKCGIRKKPGLIVCQVHDYFSRLKPVNMHFSSLGAGYGRPCRVLLF